MRKCTGLARPCWATGVRSCNRRRKALTAADCESAEWLPVAATAEQIRLPGGDRLARHLRLRGCSLPLARPAGSSRIVSRSCRRLQYTGVSHRGRGFLFDSPAVSCQSSHLGGYRAEFRSGNSHRKLQCFCKFKSAWLRNAGVGKHPLRHDMSRFTWSMDNGC